MHIAAGAPVCPTSDDVQALYQHAPNHCGTARDDLPVAIMQNAGASGPYRVRLLDEKQGIKDYWVPYVSLAN
jgi:hypothetical protein